MGDRISTALGFDLIRRTLSDQQAQLFKVQKQISSGKQVNSPKDNPIAISRLLTLKQQQSVTAQYQKNIDSVTTDLTFEESLVTEAVHQLQEAKSLIIQANSGINSVTDHKAITVQLEQLLTQLVNIANTNIEGKYVFNGGMALTPDSRPAVIKDANGTYVYNGDETQQITKVASSLAITTSDTAKSIFFNVPTSDVTVAGYSGRTNVTSAAGGLVNSASLGAVTANTLKINGITIAAAAADGVSTTDITASAIATAAAINASTDLHGVIAEANANTFDFTGGTFATNALVAGDLTINGVQIIGAPLGATSQDLADLINIFSVPGIVASDNAGQLRLVAADGRNIQLQTNGAAAAMKFSNFASGGGAVLNEVQKSTFTLRDHAAITIEGSITGTVAGKIGIAAGVYAVAANAGTGVMSTPAIVSARPAGSSGSDKYLIKFETATTFNIYKESDPNTPLTNFRKFSSGQTIANSVNVDRVPLTYTAGDSIVVEGLQFSLTGTPNSGDTFTVALTPVPTQNVFNSLQNAITSIRSYSGNHERLSFEVGQALINLSNAESQMTDMIAQVGTRLNLAENQKAANSDFNFFSQQSVSMLEDVDYAKAISELLKYQMTYDATQRVAVRLRDLSLFNYL